MGFGKGRALALGAAAALAAAGPAAAAGGADRQAGERIARRYCAECHAIGRRGPSPLAEAPPFRTLHSRYPAGGGLNDLLAEGMVAAVGPEEEGGPPPRHPRMPQVRLDEAEIGQLTAFLHALQPPGR